MIYHTPSSQAVDRGTSTMSSTKFDLKHHSCFPLSFWSGSVRFFSRISSLTDTQRLLVVKGVGKVILYPFGRVGVSYKGTLAAIFVEVFDHLEQRGRDKVITME